MCVHMYIHTLVYTCIYMTLVVYMSLSVGNPRSEQIRLKKPFTVHIWFNLRSPGFRFLRADFVTLIIWPRECPYRHCRLHVASWLTRPFSLRHWESLLWHLWCGKSSVDSLCTIKPPLFFWKLLPSHPPVFWLRGSPRFYSQSFSTCRLFLTSLVRGSIYLEALRLDSQIPSFFSATQLLPVFGYSVSPHSYSRPRQPTALGGHTNRVRLLFQSCTN